MLPGSDRPLTHPSSPGPDPLVLRDLSILPEPVPTMCKLCISAFLLVATLSLANAFFLPIFERKHEPQTPAVSNNVGWARGSQPAQSTYKDYPSYSSHIQPIQMASMQQFSYEPAPSMMMTPYHQMRLQPQFHDVQLVPCMCPLTRELIEQQTQGLMQAQSMQQAAAVQQNPDSTKLNNVQTKPSN